MKVISRNPMALKRYQQVQSGIASSRRHPAREFAGFLNASFGNLTRHSSAANPYIWMDRTGLEMG